jgi:phosphoribosylaminoimidazole-succinocarboxamide synthase
MEIEKIKEHIDDVLIETNFPELGEKKVGKVRDVYVADDHITLISTDRHSSFDRNIAFVPFKGEVLNQISLFWFEKTKDIIQNHVLNSPDSNVVIVKKCIPLPVEVVPRAYMTGSTGTSLATHYKAGKRDFGDFVLPDGMKKNQKLPEIVITPTTKSDEHDRPLTSKEIIGEGLMSEELWKQVTETTLRLFKRGQEIAATHGIILADTKYEFGLDENGKLMLIDEIHTPDSSKFWLAESYQERFEQGLEPECFDKEPLRLWLKDHCDPYKDVVIPKIPIELVAELSRRYIEIYETITGKKFEHDFSQSIINRIENNLKKYQI